MAAPTVTMSVNTNTSDGIDLIDMRAVGVFVPTGYLGNISFSTSLDGSIYFPIESGSGAVYAVTLASAPCFVPINVLTFSPIRYLKVVSNTNQNTNCVVQIAVA